MKRIIPLLLFACAMPIYACTKNPPGNGNIDPPPVPETDIITYGERSIVAVDPSGGEIGFDYGGPRDRTVGIFYFVWHGAHGYDAVEYHNGDIVPPSAADVNSPFDIHEMEKGRSNPQDIPFGAPGVMHHWGKPQLGYYVGNDAWVLRRHAQMLYAAGVDVIFIDLTNGASYLPVLEVLCNTYAAMIGEGNRVPRVSFVLNSGAEVAANGLMTLYDNAKYERLWYEMNGKPLILAPLDGNYTSAVKNRFTMRYAWFDTYGHGGWWGDGVNKWAWGEFSPQRDVREEMPVMAASHAHYNVGRSYSGNYRSGGSQPSNPTAGQTAAGTYFKQQFERAIECDPDLIFITGWNEWVAQRQVNEGENYSFLGKRIEVGDTYFVDCYNHEYSRDVEPCADGFRDAYYYYMTDYIRRYKGVAAVEPVNKTHDITIDGRFADWDAYGVRYRDYRGDTGDRDHWGFGYKNISLTNTTGRNDIRYAKVATDAKTLFFYAETEDDITPYTDDMWMRLFISVKGSASPSWEGFQWVVNNRVQSQSKTTLQRCKGGWAWEDAVAADYAVEGNRMEVAIPLSALGIGDARDFTVDFKWVDNAVADGDICECIGNGDSAPGDRFRYRFIFKY